MHNENARTRKHRVTGRPLLSRYVAQQTTERPAIQSELVPQEPPTRNQSKGAGVHAEVSQVQQWLNTRFLGLSASDFHQEGVVIYTISRLERPPGYDGAFFNVSNRHLSAKFSSEEKETLSRVAAALVFCDIQDWSEIELANAMCQNIDSLQLAAPAEPPPFYLVPHSVGSAFQPSCTLDAAFNWISEARKHGFEGCIAGEPRGFHLVVAVNSEIYQLQRRCDLMRTMTRQRREQSADAHAIKNSIDEIVWNYARTKLGITHVPPVDPSISAIEPGKRIDGTRIGPVLGEGTYGRVYALLDPFYSKPTGDVLKVLPKNRMSNVRALKLLDCQLEVMQLLSQAWKHPNVIQMHKVYHSADEILIRMPDGGSLNLYKRLCAREGPETERCWIIDAAKVLSVMSQINEAVCHLHGGPHVVHRDIKPENIMVSESEHDILIRLIDFDLSRVMPDDAACSGVAGSFPFMAPEMILEDRYDPFAADVWSVAIVHLEVACGVSIVRKALHLPSVKNSEILREAAELIVDHFEQPGSVQVFLEECMRPELTCCLDVTNALLEGMLKTHPVERWKAEKILQELGFHCLRKSLKAQQR